MTFTRQKKHFMLVFERVHFYFGFLLPFTQTSGQTMKLDAVHGCLKKSLKPQEKERECEEILSKTVMCELYKIGDNLLNCFFDVHNFFCVYC